MADAANGYDGSSIKTLSPLVHIRHRPGMYIGRLGDGSHPDDGIYVLVKEIIDNCIDEFTMACPAAYQNCQPNDRICLPSFRPARRTD